MKKISCLLVVVVCLVLSANVFAEDAKKVSGSLDANYTYDTRDMNRLTLDTLIFFPHGISYYNFFHLNSNMNGDNDNLEITNFYHEHDIWWNFYKKLPLDAVFQWQVGQGGANDNARFGFRWRISDTPIVEKLCKKINLFLTTQLHALQTDFHNSPGWGFSFEHFWKMSVLPKLLDNRVYIAGFMDHNVNYGSWTKLNGDNHAIVTETQLGVRTIGNLNAISEFRYSDYDVDHMGVAFGLEYIVNF